jgi:hypothetical protein
VQRKEAVPAEIKACLALHFADRKEEIQVRLAVTDLIFGVKSKEAATPCPWRNWSADCAFCYEKIPQPGASRCTFNPSWINHDRREVVVFHLISLLQPFKRVESTYWSSRAAPEAIAEGTALAGF